MAAKATTKTIPKPTAIRPVPVPLNSPSYEPPEPPATRTGPAPWRVKIGMVVPWLLAIFLCGLILQVYLAGYGLQEVGGQGMSYHMEFAHVIEFVPLLILIFGFLGADKWAGIGGIALLVMFQLQYLFIGLDEPIVRALHPTNGVLMVLLTLGLLLHRPMWSMPAKAPQA